MFWCETVLTRKRNPLHDFIFSHSDLGLSILVHSLEVIR